MAAVLAIATGGAAQADTGPYRLVPGDRLSIGLVGQGQPTETHVDIDGNIRLLDVGEVAVAGLTLNDAEAKLEELIAAAGIYVDPNATLTVQDYAPVVVAGDIRAPGRIDYLPGMTIATALSIAGGTAVSGVDRFEIERARVQVAGQLRDLNLSIASIAVRIARFEAVLDGDTEVALSSELEAAIPGLGAVDLPRLLREQTAILDAERRKTAEILALWDAEISSATRQLELFEDRIALQQEISRQAGEELENIRGLDEQGLATGQRLFTASQRDADERARLLELEAAQIGVSRFIAEAERRRVTLLIEAEADARISLADARLELRQAVLDYAIALEQNALLSGGNVTALLAETLVEIRYTIVSPRPERLAGAELTAQTRLLPGDTLIVQVVPAPLPLDDS
ncbi:MAG: polysaccharide biosynthesis/export family protein [Pseudomonadota bacterium]